MLLVVNLRGMLVTNWQFAWTLEVEHVDKHVFRP